MEFDQLFKLIRDLGYTSGTHTEVIARAVMAAYAAPMAGGWTPLSGQPVPTEAAAMAATVPDGYVLVPLVPTDDQRNAPFVGRIEDQSCTRQAARRDEVDRVYKAMLAAAPQAPVADPPTNEDQKYWFRKGFEWAETMGKPAPKGDGNG